MSARPPRRVPGSRPERRRPCRAPDGGVGPSSRCRSGWGRRRPAGPPSPPNCSPSPASPGRRYSAPPRKRRSASTPEPSECRRASARPVQRGAAVPAVDARVRSVGAHERPRELSFSANPTPRRCAIHSSSVGCRFVTTRSNTSGATLTPSGKTGHVGHRGDQQTCLRQRPLGAPPVDTSSAPRAARARPKVDDPAAPHERQPPVRGRRGPACRRSTPRIHPDDRTVHEPEQLVEPLDRSTRLTEPRLSDASLAVVAPTETVIGPPSTNRRHLVDASVSANTRAYASVALPPLRVARRAPAETLRVVFQMGSAESGSTIKVRPAGQPRAGRGNAVVRAPPFDHPK